MRNLIKVGSLFACFFINNTIYGQMLVESVSGIVGNEVIYLSEVENQVLQYKAEGDLTPIEALRCKVYEDLLVQKLFLDQARIDSVTVSDSNIEGDLNLRLNNFISIAGSEKALENYFKKTMVEIRRDIMDALRDQYITETVQRNISSKVLITPSDVRKYFSGLPKDSLSIIPAKVEISIIQLDPPSNEESKLEARQKLLEIRGRILAGTSSFTAQANLYSEDKGTAVKGGEVGLSTRGALSKAYADVAFSLTKNTVSRIVESEFGYHIIQLIDRQGDMVNTRHILIKPKVKPEDVEKTISNLDSLADLIRKDSITFETAARLYSTHKDSKINGGLYVLSNPSSRVTWFTIDELDKETYSAIRNMKINEISDPYKTTDEKGNTVYRIAKLDGEIPAHRANFKDDYQQLYDLTLLEKQSEVYQEWINNKIEVTYIKVSDEFKTCNFANPGWLK
jgi:peptidyl-prolyl cis-trans isomerase SurA